VRCIGGWQLHVKRRTVARRGFNVDFPAELLDDGFADAKSQTSPTFLSRIGRVRLSKALE
jgi:hypothetical protein